MQSSYVSDNDSNENGNHLRTVYENCGLGMNLKAIFAVRNTTLTVV